MTVSVTHSKIPIIVTWLLWQCVSLFYQLQEDYVFFTNFKDV